MGPGRRREEEQCGSPGEYKDKIVDSECEALREDRRKPAVFHEARL